MNIAQFAAKSNLSIGLIRAVVRQAGGWEAFQEMARDVTNHGAAGGFSGFTYYSDTEPFAQRNKDAIIEMAKQMADDMGEPGALSLIAGFNWLRDRKLSGDDVAECVYRKGHEDRSYITCMDEGRAMWSQSTGIRRLSRNDALIDAGKLAREHIINRFNEESAS